jgi:hypothetical protein
MGGPFEGGRRQELARFEVNVTEMPWPAPPTVTEPDEGLLVYPLTAATVNE